MTSVVSWGHYPQVESEAVPLLSRFDKIPHRGKPVLAYGQGRSYGDCCLNPDGAALLTSYLDHLMAFDPATGVLRVEAGISLARLLEFSVPRGFFVPVTPGTKFVSVGGAIANDVHGKNHHSAGTFGRFVRRLALQRSTGEIIECGPDIETDLFRATVAGLGLTGLILWAEIQLIPIPGPWIQMESIKLTNLEDFFVVSADSAKSFDYTVAWMDCLARGEEFGRGIFMRGNHIAGPGPAPVPVVPRISAPIYAPHFALNQFSVQAFNSLYYGKQRQREVKSTVHFDPFFYPLDAVGNWNRIYGRRGFFQFQAVLPKVTGQGPLRQLFQAVVDAKSASFLVVVKEFGEVRSPGFLSFPRAGTTICLDFANTEKNRVLMRGLEELVIGAGGALYPAKDALMSRSSFVASFGEEQIRRFEEFRDPGFSSGFWTRVRG